MVIAGINGELIEKKIISSVDIPILYVTTGDMNNENKVDIIDIHKFNKNICILYNTDIGTFNEKIYILTDHILNDIQYE
jgi:hypothetical protein